MDLKVTLKMKPHICEKSKKILQEKCNIFLMNQQLESTVC